MIAAQLVARFPNGMTSLGILLHVEQQTGSYGAAGLVLAAASVGQAAAGPVTSRWMGAWGMRRVLTLTLTVCVAAVLCLALLPLTLPGYMAFALLAGLSTPPVQAAVRTIYPKLVNSSQLTPLFSLDASLQEIIWIIAPVVITVVSTQVGTTQGLLLVAAIMVGGGIWFISAPELGRVRIPRSRRAFGRVVLKPPVMLATILGFLLIGACSAVEVGVVATFGHGGLEAGLVLADDVEQIEPLGERRRAAGNVAILRSQDLRLSRHATAASSIIRSNGHAGAKPVAARNFALLVS